MSTLFLLTWLLNVIYQYLGLFGGLFLLITPATIGLYMVLVKKASTRFVGVGILLLTGALWLNLMGRLNPSHGLPWWIFCL